MKVGLCLPSAEPGTGRRLGAGEVIEYAVRAEELGFDSVWLADHYFVERGGAVGGSYECWTMMSYMAARTSRVKIGSLVLCNTFRHPALLAKAAATLQELSGGRLIVGLGAGWHEPEYTALGLPFDHRVTRLEENLKVMVELLAGRGAEIDTRFLKVSSPPLVPTAPKPPPEVWVAARGERMVDLTGRYADGWNMAWLGSDTGPFRRDIARLQAAERSAGRAGKVVPTVGFWVICERDGDQARATFAELPGSGLKYSREEGFTVGDVPRQQPHEVIVGSPEEVVAALRAYAEAGCQHALLSLANRPFGILKPEMLDLVASEVVPRVQAMQA